MMRVGVWALVVLFLSVGATVRAQESAVPKSKLSDVLKNKKFEADHQITDTELKAQSGSLSRYSLKFNMSYAGPPVNDLSDPSMPNPDQRSRPNRTNLSGYMGLRYRMNSDEAINASTGMHWYSPYQAVTGREVERKPGDKNLTVANPQVSYDRTFVLASAQMLSSFKGSVTTEDYYLNKGQMGALSFEQSAKYNLGQSPWVVGLYMPFDLFLFGRDYKPYVSKKEPGDGTVSNYFFSAIPSVEYKLSRTFNFKTSVAYSFANGRRFGSWYKWQGQAVSARAGFGWGISRDIYINPYLNFFTANPQWATTSLSFSTVFSVF